MKTFLITVVYKRPDGTTSSKALFRVDADTEEKAKAKLEVILTQVNDQPHVITEVKS